MSDERSAELGNTFAGKGFKTGDVVHRVSKDRPKLPVALHGPTMVVGKSSKVCPRCESVRIRRFERGLPMTHDECERHRETIDLRVYGKKFPYHEPKNSRRDKWWNIWPLYLIVSPLPNAKYYFCWEVATCKKCGTAEKVEENCYYRQFGLIRVFIFVAGDEIAQLCSDIRHLIMPNR